MGVSAPGGAINAVDTVTVAADRLSRSAERARPGDQVTDQTHLSSYTDRELLNTILSSLDQDKAEDIVAIDLASKTPIADHMVVASGRSHRHVGALADKLIDRIKQAGFGNARVEGLNACDWVLIDAGDVVVHLFRPEVRDYYRIEKMWSADMPAEDVAV